MCSSPKGGQTKPRLSSQVDGMFTDMSSAEYSDMVRRANESYESRQEELAILRKNRKNKSPSPQHKPVEAGLFDKIKLFFSLFTTDLQVKNK